MPKRFTDTEKWCDSWFSALSPELKLVWMFLLDRCDAAGVYEHNDAFMAYALGHSYPIASLELAYGKDRAEVIGDGKLWLVKFLSFQYPNGFHSKSKVHEAIRRRVAHHGLSSRLGLAQPYPSPRVQETETETETETDQEAETLDFKATGKKSPCLTQDWDDDLLWQNATRHKPWVKALIGAGCTVNKSTFRAWGGIIHECFGGNWKEALVQVKRASASARAWPNRFREYLEEMEEDGTPRRILT